jgi:mRNA guanylyltransferase
MKEMFRVQDAYVLFEHVLPRLEHENDGLIFTVDSAPYYMGSCAHIWKWKPMHLNTIDFNVRQIENSALKNVWALSCTKGELFDFLVIP